MPTNFQTVESHDPEHDVDAQPHAPTPPPPPRHDGIFVKAEHIALTIAMVIVLVYLAGSSERGVIKMVERNALSKRKMPSSFSYVLMHIVNSMTFGFMGLVMNVSLDDPFMDVPVTRTDGRANSGTFVSGSPS